MIVTMTARYEALHHDDAVSQGTAIWRDFIGDPEAELPWDSTIRVELGSDHDVTADGTVVNTRPHGEAVLSVKVSSSKE